MPKHLSEVLARLRRPGVSSRTRFASELCELFGFRDARGGPQVGSCLRALRDLEEKGEIELPERQPPIGGKWKPKRLANAVAAPVGVPNIVGDVEELHVELVDPKDSTAMRTWNELIIREHPRGEQRLVGRQLRYLVNSKHGYLGAVGFAAPALALEARERWIGWSAEQLRTHRERVLNLSRLLIRPSVHCRNLASHVIAACTRRVVDDFAARFGYEPWLLETFVDRDQHVGTCFQAANWQRIGQTKGRGRNDRTGDCAESVKDLYVCPLTAKFRELMGVPPDCGDYLRPLRVEEGLSGDRWIEQEFGTVELGDKRLRDRLMTIIDHRAQRPDTSYLDACDGDRGAIKGYYAFVDNPSAEITPESMLSTHRTRTIERMMSEKLVLVVQDTTDLNYSSRSHTEGLGPIGTNQTGALSLGLKLHTSLALTEDGLPLGVLKSVAYAPEEINKAQRIRSVHRPIEEKGSFRWIEGYRECVAISKQTPNTRYLVVMDREADFFEMFEEAVPTQRRVGLLVRAKYNRQLKDSDRKLFDELRANADAVEVDVAIPRQRWKNAKGSDPEQEGLPARRAVLTIAFQKVLFNPTRTASKLSSPVEVYAVYARENQPPAGATPIEWLLLTTDQVETSEQAVRMLDLYSRRWRIEEWHRVLKSGCKVEAHQHTTADRLKRVIAMDAVIAWRIQLMTLLSREAPDMPCEVLFDEWEVKVIRAVEERRIMRPLKQDLTLAEAVTVVAKLGGYMARPSDPAPGPKVMWRGLTQLHGMIDGFRLAMPHDA